MGFVLLVMLAILLRSSHKTKTVNIRRCFQEHIFFVLQSGCRLGRIHLGQHAITLRPVAAEKPLHCWKLKPKLQLHSHIARYNPKLQLVLSYNYTNTSLCSTQTCQLTTKALHSYAFRPAFIRKTAQLSCLQRTPEHMPLHPLTSVMKRPSWGHGRKHG
jgi:hypothetical protein